MLKCWEIIKRTAINQNHIEIGRHVGTCFEFRLANIDLLFDTASDSCTVRVTGDRSNRTVEVYRQSLRARLRCRTDPNSGF